MVKPFAPLVGAVSRPLSLPATYSQDSVTILGATYMARADKARAELGWTTRPLQTGMLETFKMDSRNGSGSRQTARPGKTDSRVGSCGGAGLVHLMAV
ncbi:MAG: hypothetical protein M5U34_42215 [Chloroflexi bacterium]|nr:hypothetical protein [Chloroflexota bacterium]